MPPSKLILGDSPGFPFWEKCVLSCESRRIYIAFSHGGGIVFAHRGSEMTNLKMLLLSVFVLVGSQLMASAQCSSIQTLQCSCPGGGGLTITVCTPGYDTNPFGLWASCCHGRQIATCYSGQSCTGSQLVNKPANAIKLAAMSASHLVLVPDCQGGLRAVLQPQSAPQPAPDLDLSLHAGSLNRIARN